MKRSLEVGERVGNYEIRSHLGEGGMGEVYEAFDQVLKRKVAIKTLRPETARDSKFRERFLREGEAASRIEHPHVVRIKHFGEYQGLPYLVMDFLQGIDLAHYLGNGHRLTILESLALLLPVASGVAAGHDADVIHRDLKPGNIFLCSGGAKPLPVVLDFGLSKFSEPAKPAQPALTMSAAVMGTPRYMSPEQVDHPKDVNARTDQYALALILYECVTGQPTYPGEEGVLGRVLNGDFTKPSFLVGDLPPEFEAVMLRALAKDRNERYGSVREFARALLPFADPETQALWARLESGLRQTSDRMAARPDPLVATERQNPPAGRRMPHVSPLPATDHVYPPTPTQVLSPGPDLPRTVVLHPPSPGAPPRSGAPAAAPRWTPPKPGAASDGRSDDRSGGAGGARLALTAVMATATILGGGALGIRMAVSSAEPLHVPAPPPQPRPLPAPPAPAPAPDETVEISLDRRAPRNALASFDGAQWFRPTFSLRKGERKQVHFRAEGYLPLVEVVEALTDRQLTLRWVRARPVKPAPVKPPEARPVEENSRATPPPVRPPDDMTPDQ